MYEASVLKKKYLDYYLKLANVFNKLSSARQLVRLFCPRRFNCHKIWGSRSCSVSVKTKNKMKILYAIRFCNGKGKKCSIGLGIEPRASHTIDDGYPDHCICPLNIFHFSQTQVRNLAQIISDCLYMAPNCQSTKLKQEGDKM